MTLKLKRTTLLGLATASLAVGRAILTTGPRLRRMPPQSPDPNPYNLPSGKPIERTLKQWFKIQAKEILGLIPDVGAPLPTAFPALADYDDPMAAAIAPILALYWQESGKRVRVRLGLDPDQWQVSDPNLRHKIDAAALAFCADTNATTSLMLNEALDKLREELAEGLVDRGDSIPELTRRVNGVFDSAETWRAKRIAATEAARAVHAAQEQSAIESGVVAGFELLISGDACSLCQMVVAEVGRVPLGGKFAVIGDHPAYRDIRHPPIHVHCQCSIVEILTPAYGGPDAPEWGRTLDQPSPPADYRPPRKVEPEPEKLKVKPTR